MTTNDHPTNDMSNLDVLKTHYAAAARGDAAAAVAVFAPDIEWIDPAGASNVVLHGPDEIRAAVFDGLAGGDWENHRATPEQFIEGEEVIVSIGRYTGLFRPTGHRLDQRYAHLWSFAGGQIVRYEAFTNTMQMQQVVTPDA